MSDSPGRRRADTIASLPTPGQPMAPPETASWCTVPSGNTCIGGGWPPLATRTSPLSGLYRATITVAASSDSCASTTPARRSHGVSRAPHAPAAGAVPPRPGGRAVQGGEAQGMHHRQRVLGRPDTVTEHVHHGDVQVT